MQGPIGKIISQQGYLLLDGALGTELEERGADLNDPLWSAKMLTDNVPLLKSVGLSYLEAGADVVVSASYQASVAGFMKKGLNRSASEDLIRHSIVASGEVRDRFWAKNTDYSRLKPLVAASVGPYGAYLADGSEYTGDYAVGDKALAEFHRINLSLMAEEQPDIFAFETIPSFRETKVLTTLLQTLLKGYTGWISFTCKNREQISDGTPIKEVVKFIDEIPQIEAVGFNCFDPAIGTDLLRLSAEVTNKPLAIYPNSGEQWNSEQHCWTGDGMGKSLSDYAETWHRHGAKLIGGC